MPKFPRDKTGFTSPDHPEDFIYLFINLLTKHTLILVFKEQTVTPYPPPR